MGKKHTEVNRLGLLEAIATVKRGKTVIYRGRKVKISRNSFERVITVEGTPEGVAGINFGWTTAKQLETLKDVDFLIEILDEDAPGVYEEWTPPNYPAGISH